MKKLFAVLLVLPLMAESAYAETKLTASTGCNLQWVNVTVEHDDGYVVARREGQTDWFLSFDRFVPDIGGTNPAGDYGIVMHIQLWDRPDPSNHRLLAETSVRTPNCAPTTTTTTVPPPTVAATLPPARPAPPIIEPSLSWIPALPDALLRAIVEAVRGLP